MKNELRYVPLIGWSFWLLEMVFVKRDFVKDKPNLIKGFQKYGSYPLKSVVSYAETQALFICLCGCFFVCFVFEACE